ncbi:MAG: purine-nucleoside phosphorylase [Candidatus Kapabacteria bacterium]|jgi:purine-nucleoside phosphorylase|nr:purine-nucleoside phosphorylase [Candidatus Kapabacteria bacterium]
MNTALQQALEQHYGSLYSQLRSKTSATVEGIVISGSGLNKALEHYVAEEVIDLHEIEGFPQPTVKGHSSLLRIITIEGKRVAHYTGRCHLYEGFTLQQSLAQVALGKMLGAGFTVLTNSAGGMHHSYAAGDIMLITDTLNLMLRPVQHTWLASLTQSAREQARELDYGRIASGENIVSTEWRKRTAQELASRGVPLHQGVYIGLTGPTFETPAEARMYRKFGEAVGMSTVHEAEFARICGMQVAACSLITNMLPESAAVNVSHDEVVHAAAIGAPRVAEFIAAACKVA